MTWICFFINFLYGEGSFNFKANYVYCVVFIMSFYGLKRLNQIKKELIECIQSLWCRDADDNRIQELCWKYYLVLNVQKCQTGLNTCLNVRRIIGGNMWMCTESRTQLKNPYVEDIKYYNIVYHTVPVTSHLSGWVSWPTTEFWGDLCPCWPFSQTMKKFTPVSTDRRVLIWVVLVTL